MVINSLINGWSIPELRWSNQSWSNTQRKNYSPALKCHTTGVPVGSHKGLVFLGNHILTDEAGRKNTLNSDLKPRIKQTHGGWQKFLCNFGMIGLTCASPLRALARVGVLPPSICLALALALSCAALHFWCLYIMLPKSYLPRRCDWKDGVFYKSPHDMFHFENKTKSWNIYKTTNAFSTSTSKADFWTGNSWTGNVPTMPWLGSLIWMVKTFSGMPGF